MSLEDVKEEILRKANKETQAIKNSGSREKDKILEAAKLKAEAMKKQGKEFLKKELHLMEKKATASNDLELKKAVLTEKKNLIDQVFRISERKLTKMSKADMKEKLNKLVKKGKKEIDVGTIFCNKKYVDILEGKTRPSDISGGIILESGDGNVSVDYSFGTLLEDYKEKNLERISKMLFK